MVSIIKQGSMDPSRLGFWCGMDLDNDLLFLLYVDHRSSVRGKTTEKTVFLLWDPFGIEHCLESHILSFSSKRFGGVSAFFTDVCVDTYTPELFRKKVSSKSFTCAIYALVNCCFKFKSVCFDYELIKQSAYFFQRNNSFVLNFC